MAGKLGSRIEASLPWASKLLSRENSAMNIRTGLEMLIPPLARNAFGLGSALPTLSGDVDLTILFTDIDDYTSITESIGDRRAQHLLRIHNALVRKALKDNGGVEVKHTGDGIMAYFPAAAAAVNCAIAIQKAVDAYHRTNPSVPLGIAIGINTGAPIHEDGDLYGTAVIVAARVAATAAGGQIIVTDVVRQLAAGKQIRFVPLGSVQLEGLSEPAPLFEVAWYSDGGANTDADRAQQKPPATIASER